MLCVSYLLHCDVKTKPNSRNNWPDMTCKVRKNHTLADCHLIHVNEKKRLKMPKINSALHTLIKTVFTQLLSFLECYYR